MFLQILIGILVYISLLILYYFYLKWSLNYYPQYDLAAMVTDQDYCHHNNKCNTAKLSFLLPSRAVADSFKPLNFWINYYYYKLIE